MRKVLLAILDGWGHSDFDGPASAGNAIEQAEVPTFRHLYADRPRTRLACSGADVGLPDGQMGNSEVGHLNLGAGRIVHQDIVRIDKAIADGSFAEHLGLHGLVDGLRERAGVLHVVGLMSDGGVHSHLRHFAALTRVLPTDVPMHVHCLTDGRDTSPTGGVAYLGEVQEGCSRSDRWKIATRHRPLLRHGSGQAVGAHRARVRPHRPRRVRRVGRRHRLPREELRERRDRRVRPADGHPGRRRARDRGDGRRDHAQLPRRPHAPAHRGARAAPTSTRSIGRPSPRPRS